MSLQDRNDFTFLGLLLNKYFRQQNRNKGFGHDGAGKPRAMFNLSLTTSTRFKEQVIRKLRVDLSHPLPSLVLRHTICVRLPELIGAFLVHSPPGRGME